jgi:opacity protein-like surface antigen
MAKICVLPVLCLLLSAFSVAQEFTPIEVFGGYSYTNFKPEGTAGINLDYGWNGAMQFNVNRLIGFTADASGHYSTPVAGVNFNSYSFLVGPVVSNRIAWGTPFVHALAGANRTSISTSGLSASDTSFAMAFGAGFDINATRRVSVRLVQIDYLFTRHGTAPMNIQNNVRVSAGVVFQLGGLR